MCEKFKKYPDLGLPHIGFNLVNQQSSKVWKDIPVNSPFYFVHSFRVLKNNDLIRDESEKYSTAFYGEEFTHLLKAEKFLEHNSSEKS